MLYWVGMGTGLLIIAGSAVKIFGILKKSVIIEKRDFIKIEQKIREDERRKIECQYQKK